MYEVAVWWAIVQIMGFAVLPLALHLFRWLPDRGYAFAKSLGILVCAYVLWLLATLGIVDNARSSAIAVVLGVLLFSWLAFPRQDVLDLWRRRRGFVVLTEVVFTLAFVLWAIVRAYNPEIAATEKPMEFAFLNGVLRSEHFPPADPWLSGYSISYYYFGYVMMAMLTKLSGLASSVTFNLSIALLFALTAAGAFGLAHNLAAGDRDREVAEGSSRTGWLTPAGCGLLGALLVAILGNLEVVFEFFHSRAALTLAFWQWLQIQNLDKPYLANQWYPTDWMWWFRASRVIGDYDPVTRIARDYTINEFPCFSFRLGDLHPHVLAMPFALLALAFALNLLRAPSGRSMGVSEPPSGGIALDAFYRRPVALLPLGLSIGGMGFLNSWDMPTYLLILMGGFAL